MRTGLRVEVREEERTVAVEATLERLEHDKPDKPTSYLLLYAATPAITLG